MKETDNRPTNLKHNVRWLEYHEETPVGKGIKSLFDRVPKEGLSIKLSSKPWLRATLSSLVDALLPYLKHRRGSHASSSHTPTPVCSLSRFEPIPYPVRPPWGPQRPEDLPESDSPCSCSRWRWDGEVIGQKSGGRHPACPDPSLVGRWSNRGTIPFPFEAQVFLIHIRGRPSFFTLSFLCWAFVPTVPSAGRCPTTPDHPSNPAQMPLYQSSISLPWLGWDHITLIQGSLEPPPFQHLSQMD